MSLDIQQLLTDNIVSIITTLFGGGSFYAYYVEKGKRKIEQKQLGADALKSMQDAYDKFTADALKHYEELSVEVENLKKKLTLVTSQLETEKQNYSTLKTAHDKLKIAYDNLKKEFENYKSKNIPKK